MLTTPLLVLVLLPFCQGAAIPVPGIEAEGLIRRQTPTRGVSTTGLVLPTIIRPTTSKKPEPTKITSKISLSIPTVRFTKTSSTSTLLGTKPTRTSTSTPSLITDPPPNPTTISWPTKTTPRTTKSVPTFIVDPPPNTTKTTPSTTKSVPTFIVDPPPNTTITWPTVWPTLTKA